MENKEIIVYGAYGYTGELIVRKCQELGIKPLLPNYRAFIYEGTACSWFDPKLRSL